MTFKPDFTTVNNRVTGLCVFLAVSIFYASLIIGRNTRRRVMPFYWTQRRQHYSGYKTKARWLVGRSAAADERSYRAVSHPTWSGN
jgi:hypothetical protein